MIYAPVLIPTLCRDRHFINSVESLKKNSWAKYTDIYVALDFPKEEKHLEGYKKICEYLENSDFCCFNSFNVIKRDENIGALYNMMMLIDDIKDKYDRWILAEDDIVFSQNFLEYMDKCLFEYENDNDVLAVTGYSFPLDYDCDYNATIFKQSKAFHTWGTGYWKHKYLKIEEDIKNGYLYSEFENATRRGKLKSLSRKNYCWFLNTVFGSGNKLYYKIMTDIAITVYMCFTDTCLITPVISKTRNMGYDGSGENCGKITDFSGEHSDVYDYNFQPIDVAAEFSVLLDSNAALRLNEKKIDRFMYVDKKEKIKFDIVFSIYRFFGFNAVKRLYALYRVFKKYDK